MNLLPFELVSAVIKETDDPVVHETVTNMIHIVVIFVVDSAMSQDAWFQSWLFCVSVP